MAACFFILVAGFLMFRMFRAAAFGLDGTIEKPPPRATARISPMMITFLFTAHLR